MVSSRNPAAAARALPGRPNLEHLKNQARRRLRELRSGAPAARLADAQLQIARDYGFSSWRQMKASIEGGGGGPGGLSRLAGFYRHDPSLTTNGVAAVTVMDGRLFLEAMNGGRFELSDVGQGRFAIAGLEGDWSFEHGDEGVAKALIHHTRASDVRLERIGDAEAAALRAAREQAEAEQNRPRTAVPVAPGILQRYVGHYVSRVGPGLEVACSDGRLLVQVVGQPQLEVFPESETCFFYRVVAAQLEFVTEAGRAEAVILHQNGMQQRLARVSAEEALRTTAGIREAMAEQARPRALAKIDPGVLDRYCGRYRLDGRRVVTVTTEDARLFVEVTGQPRFEVHPESETSFFWTVVAAQISFLTDSSGRVSHAVLHQGGRDMPLPRLSDEAEAGKGDGHA